MKFRDLPPDAPPGVTQLYDWLRSAGLFHVMEDHRGGMGGVLIVVRQSAEQIYRNDLPAEIGDLC